MISLADIQQFFYGTIKLSEPLATYTVLGVGGPADYFLEPSSEDTVEDLLKYLRKNDFPHVVLHPNMLVSDKGFRGAVIYQKANNGLRAEKRCATMFKSMQDIPASVLIEKAGMNGIFLGGAEVMGNFAVNANNATAAEILSLVQHVQRIVKQQCGVFLEVELCSVGFEEEEAFAKVT